MAMYLTKGSHTPEGWATLLANPEDRRTALSPVVEAMGGKLHGYWYAFGDADVFVLFEAPDDITVASLLVKVASTARLRTSPPPSCSPLKKHSTPCAGVRAPSIELRVHLAADGTSLLYGCPSAVVASSTDQGL
jgi:uncharacterized protein with GYD domain